MNHLIAKIRLRGSGSKYRKILSDTTLFAMPEHLEPHIEYSPGHNLDEDAWFGISSFSTKDYFLSFLGDPFNSAEYDTLSQTHIEKIDFICSYQNENEYYFQRVTKSQLISRKILYFGDAYNFNENSRTIVINHNADAIYKKDSDILYFKKLSAITNIFKGIDTLYREATEEETRDFLRNDFIQLDDEFYATKVGTINRRRIAMAVDTLNTFEEREKREIISYVRDYCSELEFSENSFVIRTNNDLKILLYGIEQRYYTTLVKGEKRLANSITTLGEP